MRLSEVKGSEPGQDCGKPKKNVLLSYFDFFSPFSAKWSTIKAFPEVSVIS